MFYDPRLNDATKFPVAARAGFGNVRPSGGADDGITSRLPALQYYQLSISAPTPPRGSYLKGAWARAKGGYYHDGRFPTLRSVVEHYNRVFELRLSETEIVDLVEYLKSI
ncbi:MAG: hypothetical protein ACRD1W_04415 [Vicinamibacterales bacterium]